MKKIIGLPKAIAFYWFGFKKEAVLDHENNELTTTIDDEDYTQKFYRVRKFEMFQFLKYVVPILFVLTGDYFGISIKHELGLIMFALAMVLWPRYRDADIRYLLGSAIAVSLTLPIIGTITWTLSTLIHMYITAVMGMVAYEIWLGIESKEWEYHRKVFIDGVPKFIVHYFKLPESEAQKKSINRAAANIKDKVYITAAVVAFVGLVGLIYSGNQIYQEHKAKNAAMLKYEQYLNTTQLKEQADRNGSTQIVIKFEKVKLDIKTQKLQDMLNIKPAYKKITTKTYPWEPGYERGGTWEFDTNGSLNYVLVGGQKL